MSVSVWTGRYVTVLSLITWSVITTFTPEITSTRKFARRGHQHTRKMSEISKMTVVQLRAALEERGLSTKGLKKELVSRLEKAMEDEPSDTSQIEQADANQQLEEQEPGKAAADSLENTAKLEENDVQNEADFVPNPEDSITNTEITDTKEDMQTADKSGGGDADQQINEPKESFVSDTLEIRNLTRPFTLPDLKAKLTSYGQLEYFWINGIKSYCFAQFANKNQANKALDDMNNVQWPESFGKKLEISFISLDDARSRAEKEDGAIAQNTTNSSSQKVSSDQDPVRSETDIMPSQSSVESAQKRAFPSSNSQDLLRTKTQPEITYLPLSEEKVAEKRRKRVN